MGFGIRLTCEIQAVYAISGNQLVFSHWRERIAMSGRAGMELTPMRPHRNRAVDGPRTQRSKSRGILAGPPTLSPRCVQGGPLHGISLRSDSDFLEVATTRPPACLPRRTARIVELEPDRYFAAANREALAVTVAPDESIAFGAPASPSHRGWPRSNRGRRSKD